MSGRIRPGRSLNPLLMIREVSEREESRSRKHLKYCSLSSPNSFLIAKALVAQVPVAVVWQNFRSFMSDTDAFTEEARIWWGDENADGSGPYVYREILHAALTDIASSLSRLAS